jgi:hypothetical protein
MKTERYIACTLDGSVIYTTSTAQTISDAVIEHRKANRKPHIAYTYDTLPGTVWPYTTWREAIGRHAWLGTPWKNYFEVCAEVKARV